MIPVVDIDWPRTLAVGGITTVIAVALYAADTYEGYRSGEGSAGLAPVLGMAAGLLAGLLAANLMFA